jgi:hypothetical protein
VILFLSAAAIPPGIAPEWTGFGFGFKVSSVVSSRKPILAIANVVAMPLTSSGLVQRAQPLAARSRSPTWPEPGRLGLETLWVLADCM